MRYNNWLLAVAACVLLAGCEYKPATESSGTTPTEGGESGGTGSYVVQIAGSSTVSPVSSAVAEEADN
ncbi:MAG: hypothetical protein KDA78_21235, partial [Planctomycetaceae bacterium]|nr:hypothetical protein [Planctomycetaceae bacterium]